MLVIAFLFFSAFFALLSIDFLGVRLSSGLVGLVLTYRSHVMSFMPPASWVHAGPTGLTRVRVRVLRVHTLRMHVHRALA